VKLDCAHKVVEEKDYSPGGTRQPASNSSRRRVGAWLRQRATLLRQCFIGRALALAATLRQRFVGRALAATKVGRALAPPGRLASWWSVRVGLGLRAGLRWLMWLAVVLPWPRARPEVRSLPLGRRFREPLGLPERHRGDCICPACLDGYRE
jgi:hypothetical protein